MSQVTYVTISGRYMSQNDFVTNRLEVLNKIVTNRRYNFGTHRFFFVTYRLGVDPTNATCDKSSVTYVTSNLIMSQ